MTTFKKTVLLEDRTYHSPDGKVVVNPKNKKHWAEKVVEFNSSKVIDIPVFWDHSDDPKISQPIKRKNGKRLRAKGQAGWLTNAAIADDGGLELEFDIPNEKDAQQVADNLTKVSPVFWDELSDGRGNQHENVIGACDLVVHPVDDTQTNFTPVPAIACSLVRLSLDGKPKIYRLADDEEDSDHNSDHDSDDEASGDGSDDVRLVIEGLAALNIILPDDTDKENFWERAPSAIMTAKAMGDDGVDNEPLESTSPEFAAFSLSPLGKFQSKTHQKGVMSRLDAVLAEGRCTPAEYKDHKSQVSSIRLSLNDNGEHKPTAIEEWIQSREGIPAGSCWDPEKRTRMSNTLEVVPHPDGLQGDEVTEEQAEAIADEIFA